MLEVARRIVVQWGYILHAQGFEKFGQEDASHRIDAVEGYAELLPFDGWYIDKVEAQYKVDVLLVVGVVFYILA